VEQVRVLYVDGPHPDQDGYDLKSWWKSTRDSLEPYLQEFCRYMLDVEDDSGAGCPRVPHGCGECAELDSPPMCVELSFWPGFGDTLQKLRQTRGTHFALCFVDLMPSQHVEEDWWPQEVPAAEYEWAPKGIQLVTGEVIIEEINKHHRADLIVVASARQRPGIKKLLQTGGRAHFWVPDPTDLFNFQIALAVSGEIQKARVANLQLPSVSEAAFPDNSLGEGKAGVPELFFCNPNGKPTLRTFLPGRERPVKEIRDCRAVLLNRHMMRLRGLPVTANSTYFRQWHGFPELQRRGKEGQAVAKNRDIYYYTRGKPFGGGKCSAMETGFIENVFRRLYPESSVSLGPFRVDPGPLNQLELISNVDEAWKMIWHGFQWLHSWENVSTSGRDLLLQHAERLFAQAALLVEQEGLAQDARVRDWELLLIPGCALLATKSLGGTSDEDLRAEGSALCGILGELLADYASERTRPSFEAWASHFLPLAHWAYCLVREKSGGKAFLIARNTFQEELYQLYPPQETRSLYQRVLAR